MSAWLVWPILVVFVPLGLMHLLWIPKAIWWPEPAWSKKGRIGEILVGVLGTFGFFGVVVMVLWR